MSEIPSKNLGARCCAKTELLQLESQELISLISMAKCTTEQKKNLKPESNNTMEKVEQYKQTLPPLIMPSTSTDIQPVNQGSNSETLIFSSQKVLPLDQVPSMLTLNAFKLY